MMPINETEQEDEDYEELLLLLLLLRLSALSYGVSVGNSMILESVDGYDLIDVENELAYVTGLIAGIQSTTDAQVAKIIEKWKIEGGNLTDMLEPVFSTSRAEMIAVTETTKAIQAGESIVFDLSDEVESVIFHTQEDERVCEICGPLDNEVLDLDSEDLPPLHPNCRCYTEPNLEGAGDRE